MCTPSTPHDHWPMCPGALCVPLTKFITGIMFRGFLLFLDFVPLSHPTWCPGGNLSAGWGGGSSPQPPCYDRCEARAVQEHVRPVVTTAGLLENLLVVSEPHPQRRTGPRPRMGQLQRQQPALRTTPKSHLQAPTKIPAVGRVLTALERCVGQDCFQGSGLLSVL